MMELLRRTILLAGLLLGIWMYLATPPALLRFEVVDFAARYDQEFRQRRETPGQGVYERGRALAAALGDPGSVDGFIAQATEHRLIRIQGAEWERLVSELTSAATAAASAPTAAGGHARARFARTTDAPFTTVMGQIDRIRSEAGSSVSYLALGTGPATRYLEVMYVDAPASSGGPSALVHPSRPSSWIPLLIGLAGYLLIPWRRSAPAIVSVDRLPAVLVLDAIGTACASIFFALPLHLAGATASALGDDLGMTVLLWCLAGCGAALVIWAARNAAYAIHVSDSALRFSSLGGTREYLYGDIQQVRPLAAGDVPRAGVVLQLRDGRVESIPWRGLLRFPMLLDALSRHGRPLPPHTADDRTPAGAASQAAARLHGAPPRRLLSTGRVAGVAIAAVVAGAGVWYITQTRTAPTATNWQASHQQKLAATIEAAIKAPDTVTTLDLAGADFVRLPDGFDRLTSLRELSLNGSTHLDVAAVLTQLATLPLLERLELAETGIAAVPPEIGGLVHLKSLLLWNNEIAALPPELGRLRELDWINLAQNHLTTLPPELAQLKALTSLDLQQNALGELPAVVCRLTSLTSLDLKGNSELASLPACIGDLAALEFLGLAFTFELRALPPEVTKLTRLKEISALESGFVKTSQLEALRAAMPTTRITGREEGQLLDQMQKMEAEGDRIQKEEDAARRKRLRVR